MSSDRNIDSSRLLAELLVAADPAGADLRLTEILELVVEPIASRFVKKRLHIAFAGNEDSILWQDALDIIGDVKLAMMATLQRLRAGESDGVIDSVEGYTVTVARNACNEYLRRKYPARFRLQNQLRYVFLKDDQLSMSSDAEGIPICGMANTVSAFDSSGGRLGSLNGFAPSVVKAMTGRVRDARTVALGPLVREIFREAKQPIAFDELVAIVGEIRGLKEPRTVELADDIGLAEKQSDPYAEIDRRAFLQAVWATLTELPLRHRQALLLHLSDDLNDNLLIMFPVDGVASIRMIAELIEMPAERLAAIWGRLPLPDSEIAEFMGLKRQQVINLRHSARRSLRAKLADSGFF